MNLGLQDVLNPQSCLCFKHTDRHRIINVTVVIVSILFLFNNSKHSQIELSECEATLDLAKSLMFERILLLLCPALR